MTWTYDEPVEDGWANPIHEVRYLLGDTNETKFSPSDEVLGMLSARWKAAYPDDGELDLFYVAAVAAEGMSLGYAGAVSAVSASDGSGSVSRTYVGEASRLSNLTDWLWKQSRTPRPGDIQGLGRATKATPERQFGIGHMDTPGTTGGTPVWLERLR